MRSMNEEIQVDEGKEMFTIGQMFIKWLSLRKRAR